MPSTTGSKDSRAGAKNASTRKRSEGTEGDAPVRIIKFSCENYRCFADETTLDFNAFAPTGDNSGKMYLGNKLIPHDVEGAVGLVPHAMLIGSNSSGKSAFLRAFGVMKSLVAGEHLRMSSPRWDAFDPPLTPEPFAFNSDKRMQPSKFSVVLYVKGRLYKYSIFAIEDEEGSVRIVEEFLGRYRANVTSCEERMFPDLSKDHKTLEKNKDLGVCKELKKHNDTFGLDTIFYRCDVNNVNTILFDFALNMELTKLLSGLINTQIKENEKPNEVYAKYLGRNLALRSIVASSLEPITPFNEIYDWFERSVYVPATMTYQFLKDIEIMRRARQICDDKELKEQLTNVLRRCNPAICDWRVSRNKRYTNICETKRKSAERPPNNDRSGQKKQPADRDLWLSLDAESDGTLKVFMLYVILLSKRSNGYGLFAIDELDAHIHSLLLESFLTNWRIMDGNIGQPQVMFTAHNLLHIWRQIRPDEVWRVSRKGEHPSGNNQLISDSEKSILSRLTESNNVSIEMPRELMEKYYEGIFGAVPIV